jgi:transposase-like protein
LQHITRKRFIPIRAENLEMAVQALEDFIAEWKSKYRKVMESLENADNLLTFYQFPYQIWHSIYSTNLIESLNKEIKRQTKKKGEFLTRMLWNFT